jgi:NAD(P)H-hydrate epimerase
LIKQIEFSKKYNAVVVQKGANTKISTPQGKIFLNTTGNPGMATGGSGDVLTGIILALLSQGYSAEDSAKIGVFIHGLAADLKTAEICEISLTPSDIIENLGKAFNLLKC